MIFVQYRMSWAWGLLILVLCGIPGQDLPKGGFWDFQWMDKVAHVGIFSILSFLMVWESRRKAGTARLRKTAVQIILIGMAYGALTEVLQHYFFSGRFADVTDFIADSLGAIFGTFLATRWFLTRP